MKYLKYPVAGLDFIFDKNYKPWFIETNSASTLHREFEEIYGYPITLKRIRTYINRFDPKRLCCFCRKKHRYRKGKENGAWISNRLKEYFPDANICYMEKNLKANRGFFINDNFNITKKYRFRKNHDLKLINSEKKKIRPDFLVRSYFQLRPEFEKVNMINSMIARDIVWFKHKTYEIVKGLKGVNIPDYFIINKISEVRDLLKQNKDIFKHGYVLKPVSGSLGQGIIISKNRNLKIKKIMGTYMLQKRIDVPLEKRKYWDTRSFVINNKFIGGVKRTSKKRVTNIYLGAKGEELSKDLQKKIKQPALRIVKAIEKECRKKIRYTSAEKVKLLNVANFQFNEE